MTRRALILCLHLQRHLDRYLDLFARHGIEIEAPKVVQQLGEEDLVPIIGRFDGVVAGDDNFSARVIEAAGRLKVISKWGIGVDGIDRLAAERCGVAVYNTPDVFADEVGDVVLGYLVLLARQLHLIDAAVRRGEWFKPQGSSLAGKRLGVVGVGSIGKAVARRGRAIGMEVLGHDVMGLDSTFVEATGVRPVGLEALLEESDFVSLNCPLTAENHRFFDAAAFERMKVGSYLINTARGTLVDESALAEALQAGKLAGAALDVYESEPLPADSPLRACPGVIFGSHNASNTQQAVERVNEMAVANLLRGMGIAG